VAEKLDTSHVAVTANETLLALVEPIGAVATNHESRRVITFWKKLLLH